MQAVVLEPPSAGVAAVLGRSGDRCRSRVRLQSSRVCEPSWVAANFGEDAGTELEVRPGRLSSTSASGCWRNAFSVSSTNLGQRACRCWRTSSQRSAWALTPRTRPGRLQGRAELPAGRCGRFGRCRCHHHDRAGLRAAQTVLSARHGRQGWAVPPAAGIGAGRPAAGVSGGILLGRSPAVARFLCDSLYQATHHVFLGLIVPAVLGIGAQLLLLTPRRGEPLILD